MTTDLTHSGSGAGLAALYRATLLDDVIPFWLRHGLDPEHGGILTVLDQDGKWYSYLHRDGRVSQRAKGNLFNGPFHLPRMLWYCWRRLA